MLKTTVILTKIWFFFSVKIILRLEKPLHHAAAVINCIGSFFFFFKSMSLKETKKIIIQCVWMLPYLRASKESLFFYYLIYSEPEYIGK